MKPSKNITHRALQWDSEWKKEAGEGYCECRETWRGNVEKAM